MLLRRAFSIYDVRPDHGGTVEFLFAVVGPGTRWLAGLRTRDMIDIAGPLGRPFPVPRDPVNCLLVGGGYGIAQYIQAVSDDILRVDEGSLYPALQRLLQEGWIKAEWGTSTNKRRARFYRLTVAGRRQLTAEHSRWERFTEAVARILRPSAAEEQP